MRIRRAFRVLALTLLLWGTAVLTEAVAIVVAPTAVYLTDRSPASAVTLFNPSNVPEEVSVDVLFGYPTTSDDGNLYLHLDSTSTDARSAAEWIQALPRRLVVPPGERRVVRLLARHPAGTPDGEYWARLLLTSRGQSIPVGDMADSSAVQVGLALEVRTIIAVTYRKGVVETSLSVGEFAPEIVGDSLILRPELQRGGVGAYIGRMEVRLATLDGQELRRWEEQVAVYRTYHRRYAYDVADVEPGTYQVLLRFTTDREDIAPAHRLQTPPMAVAAEVVRP